MPVWPPERFYLFPYIALILRSPIKGKAKTWIFYKETLDHAIVSLLAPFLSQEVKHLDIGGIQPG